MLTASDALAGTIHVGLTFQGSSTRWARLAGLGNIVAVTYRKHFLRSTVGVVGPIGGKVFHLVFTSAFRLKMNVGSD
jgi:hypothetical protein